MTTQNNIIVCGFAVWHIFVMLSVIMQNVIIMSVIMLIIVFPFFTSGSQQDSKPGPSLNLYSSTLALPSDTYKGSTVVTYVINHNSEWQYILWFCCVAHFCYAECHYAECHYYECNYAERVLVPFFISGSQQDSKTGPSQNLSTSTLVLPSGT